MTKIKELLKLSNLETIQFELIEISDVFISIGSQVYIDNDSANDLIKSIDEFLLSDKHDSSKNEFEVIQKLLISIKKILLTDETMDDEKQSETSWSIFSSKLFAKGYKSQPLFTKINNRFLEMTKLYKTIQKSCKNIKLMPSVFEKEIRSNIGYFDEIRKIADSNRNEIKSDQINSKIKYKIEKKLTEIERDSANDFFKWISLVLTSERFIQHENEANFVIFPDQFEFAEVCEKISNIMLFVDALPKKESVMNAFKDLKTNVNQLYN